MKKRTLTVALTGLLASAWVMAQTPNPPNQQGTQPTDPSAASTPHQRNATKSQAGESQATSNGTNPSDASTPAQKDSVKKTHKHKKAASPDKDQSPQS